MVFSSTTFLFLFLPAVIFFYWLPDVYAKIKLLFCKKSLDNQDQKLALYSQTAKQPNSQTAKQPNSQTANTTPASVSVLTDENNVKEDAAPHSREAVTEVSEGADVEDSGNNHSPTIILFRLFISVILAVLILSTFIYFYRHSMGKENPNKTTDDNWYPNQFCSNMEEGYSWIHFDENGFNNSYPIKKDRIDILLTGSSHLEAIQMKTNENIGYLLNDLLLDYFSYNIGMSGHFLPTNVNNLENAYNFYKPTKAIIIETGNIKIELSDITSVINGILKRRTPNDKGINYYIKNYTPLLKTLGKKIVGQINLWKNKSQNVFFKNQNIPLIDNSFDKNDYPQKLNTFLAFTRKSVPDNIPIIIFYHPSYTLQTDGSIINNTDKWYLEVFTKACKNNNIIFTDTDKDLQELYKTRHILPYGFINTAVGVGHLNKYGHEVIAKRLAKEILKLEERKHGTK